MNLVPSFDQKSCRGPLPTAQTPWRPLSTPLVIHAAAAKESNSHDGKVTLAHETYSRLPSLTLPLTSYSDRISIWEDCYQLNATLLFSFHLWLLHGKRKRTIILPPRLCRKPVATNLLKHLYITHSERALPVLSAHQKQATLVPLSLEPKVRASKTPVDTKLGHIWHLGAMAPAIAAHLVLAIVCIEIAKTFTFVSGSASLVNLQVVCSTSGIQRAEHHSGNRQVHSVAGVGAGRAKQRIIYRQVAE